MKRKMKKVLSVCMSLFLVAGVITGCGNNATVSNGDVDVVEVWSGDGACKSTWEALVADFNSTIGKEKGIEIKWTTQTDSQMTQVALQNGQLPAISGTIGGNILKECYAKDLLIAIDDLPGGKEFVEQYGSPLRHEENYKNGKVYSLFSRTMTAGLIYNKDLFKKAGIVDEKGEAKAPTTAEEVREYAKKITALGNGVYGWCIPLKFGTWNTIDFPMRTAYGASVYDYDNLTIKDDYGKAAYKLVFDMKDDGSVYPGAEELDNDTARAYFAEGLVGMMTAISWDIGVLTTQFVADCDWGFVPFPAPEGKEMQTPWSSISGTYYITKNAEKIPQEKIMEVIKFIYSDETQVTFYENNIDIPIRQKILDMADESKLIPQMKGFAANYDEESTMYYWPSIKTENPKNWNIVDIWNGSANYTLDEYFDYVSNNKTAAFKKGVEVGDINIDKLKEWNNLK